VSKETNKENKSSRKILMTTVIVITAFILLTILAFFTVMIYRTYAAFKAENSEAEYRYGDLYYNSLNYRLQCLYDEIVDSAENVETMTDIVPYYYTDQEFSRVINYIKADRPDLFWFDYDSMELVYTEQKSRVNIVYEETAEEIEKMKAVMNQTVESIIEKISAEAETKNGLILSIHDWLVLNCTVSDETEKEYDYLAGTAYGAIVNGKAAADGYSTAFTLLCRKLEVYCISVYGRVFSTDHIWNLVWDGNCYRHVDVMWDDPDLSYIPELVSHAYYGLSDEEIERDRVILRETIIPDAEQPSDYYHINNMSLDGNNSKHVISELIDDCVSDNRTWFELYGTEITPALEKIIEDTVSKNELLSGWRIYTLSELYDVCAVQLYYK